jgi:radical SAM superfamily enzyme YgiQ (UPF0313 family)
MRVLLVHPWIPTTYWGFQYSLRIIAKGASLPPLGLITLAALLPGSWRLRLVDLNLHPLRDEDILWADAVLVGGMLLQAPSMREVIARARRLGRRVVAGGPAPTTTPELFTDADVVFRGEVEERVGELVEAVEGSARGLVLAPPEDTYPAVSSTPVPRFELLELSAYASMSVQYSRGCPYSCEFCDVIEMFGRAPRVKTTGQVLSELDALHALGYCGSLFFVDDNFIGNRRAVRQLLPELAAWQERHGRPFELYTEASINLASDPELMHAMVEAGFTSVFVGIESPSREALQGAGKRQNLLVEPGAAIAAMTRAGLEVMGGFIVGFDTDGEDIFARQADLICSTPMPLAMVGVLNAPPGTALWRRLEREGRLRRRSSGDQFERPNFHPAMGDAPLLSGYARLLAEIYAPEAYYRRCAALLRQLGPSKAARGGLLADLAAFLRAIFRVGVASPRRGRFWRLLREGWRGGLPAFRRAVVLAVKGEHVIRYSERDVLPRIRREAAAAAPEAILAASLRRPA